MWKTSPEHWEKTWVVTQIRVMKNNHDMIMVNRPDQIVQAYKPEVELLKW